MLKKAISLFIVMVFSLYGNERDVKVCLTMVTFNCQDTLSQCLKSVENVIDYLCIYDLGSTDDTISIIEGFLEEGCLVGKIHKQKRSQGEPLTRVLKFAQTDLKEF